jgi:hypothetical protein
MDGRSIAALVHVKADFGDFAIGVRVSSVPSLPQQRGNIRIYSRTRVDGAVTAPVSRRILGGRASRRGCEVRLLL